VAVHAHGTNGIKDALRAGVDTIEHASFADAEAFTAAEGLGRPQDVGAIADGRYGDLVGSRAIR
jgi:imidazolonepropionase-like amidohydrolase